MESPDDSIIYEHEYSLKILININTFIDGVEYMKRHQPDLIRYLVKRTTSKSDERFKNENTFDTYIPFYQNDTIANIILRRKDEENNVKYEWKGLFNRCNIFIINWLNDTKESDDKNIYNFSYTKCCERLATLDEIVQFSHRLDYVLSESACHYIDQPYTERYYIIYVKSKFTIREAYEKHYNTNGSVEFFYTYELEYNTKNKTDPYLCTFTGQAESILNEHKALYYPNYETIINFDERWLFYLEKHIIQRPFTVSKTYENPKYYAYKLDGVKSIAVYLYKKLYILSNNSFIVKGDYNIGLNFCAILAIEHINGKFIIIDILGIIKPIHEQKAFLTKSELEYTESMPWITFIKLDHITAIKCMRRIKNSDIEYNKFYRICNAESIQEAQANINNIKEPVDGILIFGDTYIYKVKKYQTIELYVDVLEMLNMNKIIEKTDKCLEDLNQITNYTNHIKDGNKNKISTYLDVHYSNLPNIMDICIDDSYIYVKIRPLLEFQVIQVFQKHNVSDIKEKHLSIHKTVKLEFIKIRNDKFIADKKNKIVSILNNV